jgi:hypothetical protein
MMLTVLSTKLGNHSVKKPDCQSVLVLVTFKYDGFKWPSPRGYADTKSMLV